MPVRVDGASRVSVQSTSSSPLKSLVPSDWAKDLAPEIDSPSFKSLDQFVTGEEAKGNVFPPRAQIFAALKDTPPQKVKVVIIGQDPYPTKGNANGLAFSVSPGMKVPGSLQNIYKGLNADMGTPIPKTGDLTSWAKNGVLLLNTVLTVREGEPNSHKGKGWEDFTTAVLKQVNKEPGPVVFLCFGAQATKMAQSLVDTKKNTIISAPHPSPLNGNKFVESAKEQHLFSKTNDILKAAGRTPVDWAIP
jgi:uracil-DNA glycosylase